MLDARDSPPESVGVHEVAIGQPRQLLSRLQRITDDGQTSSQGGLVHERHQIDGGTCQKDLVAGVRMADTLVY